MDRPNVLLICVDHWGGRLIGKLGHPDVLTPTLERFIENGIAFDNAYTTTPSCIPARREIMTGAHSRTHGDRIFDETLPMPDLPTLAQTFRDAGYQAYSVGKLHVYPQRDRIGFDEAIINEEGRHHLGLSKDDYEMFLAEQGYPGQELAHGVGNNEHTARPWHLPEYCHQTNWTVREMSKVIARRDPTRPAFWHMSFSPPHPPLAPLADYLNIYRDIDVQMPFIGQWASELGSIPALDLRFPPPGTYSEEGTRLARQAFYALITHVDHQMSLVIGLLREQGLVDNTVVMFTADHGDMLGNHGLYNKDVFYEDSARIPMVLVPHEARSDLGNNRVDHRLATQADIFPTLMDLCDIAVPDTVEGLSLVGDQRREHVYGEHWEDYRSTRMVRNERYKLVYYAAGNHFQLFDLDEDPDELRDLSGETAHTETRGRLTDILIDQLYGSDLDWLDGSELVGLPDGSWPSHRRPDRGMGSQRGLRLL
jgi:arylsulfatase A-like enzyme